MYKQNISLCVTGSVSFNFKNIEIEDSRSTFT